MVHPGRDGFAEHGDGSVGIARRSEDTRACELHGAVAEAVEGNGRGGQHEAAAEILLGHHRICPHLNHRDWMKKASG